MRILSTVLLLVLLTGINLEGQNLLESPQHATHNYLFQLTNEQAKDLYQEDAAVDFNYQLLRHLVDSIPFGEKLGKNYTAGHYLRVRLDQDQVKSDLISFQYFQAHLLDNHRDFCLQVIDTAGQMVTDAKVKINNRRIRFDETTQSYRVAKANRQGRLSIERNGVIHFYEVTRRFNKSVLNRLGGRYVKNGLVRYVWRPITYVVAAPVEAVVSLIRGRPTARIYRTGRFFNRMYHKVACMFDDYYCDNYKNEDKYTGYLVTNKPIYKPGDTLRWKAFVVKAKNGKGFTKPVDIYLWDRYPIKAKSLAHQPSHPGNYHGYFVLADSLDFQLDQRLRLSIDNKDATLLTTSVRYEDYELKRNEFSINTDQTVHYAKDSILFSITATDDNELPLADARIEILAKITKVKTYTADSVFIPDTLFYLEQALSVEKTDSIFIPSIDFPSANFSYYVKASLKTSDNELRTETLNLDYWDQQETLEHQLIKDSILFEYKENDEVIPHILQMRIEDPFGLSLTEKQVELPYKIPIQTYASNYIFTKKNQPWTKTITLQQGDAGLRFLTERQGDQVQVQVINPHQLPFNYFFYELNQEKAHGFAKQLDTSWSVKPSKNAYLSVQYLWNGRMISQDYQVPVEVSELQITTNLPPTINPGESREVEILVQDSDGAPVADVDLTAFGITQKFENYYVPSLPDLSKPSKQRKIYNEFTKVEKEPRINNTDIAYPFWNPLADLESNAYYNFRFPQDSVYTYTYPTVDSTTQFAPFFGDEPIHVIEVDQKPVYFSWTDNEQPYAFPITAGYHQIQLRLSDRMVIVDSLFFPAGKKTILGMGEGMRKNVVKLEARTKNHLGKEEEMVYRPFLMFYQTLTSRNPYFLTQKDHLLSLRLKGQNTNQDGSYRSPSFPLTKLAGPVYKGRTHFQVLEDFSLAFDYEPHYQYEFEKQLLKMKEVDQKRYFPLSFSSPQITNLEAEALSITKLEQRLALQKAYQLRTKPVYRYPNITDVGKGTLTVKLQGAPEASKSIFHRMLIPLNRPDHFQVLPGSQAAQYNLEPGWHRLYLFYQDQSYAMLDSLWVSKNGQNHYLKALPVSLPADSFSIQTMQEIAKSIFNQQPQKEALQNIQRFNQTMTDYPASWERIQGYITDETGETLIGASILVKGTTIGTVSDIDGSFQLAVPPGKHEIEVSYTGFITQKQAIVYGQTQMVELGASSEVFEELVVTGLGIAKNKMQMGYSVGAITADESSLLMGKAAGVQLVDIKVRGASSLSADAQPLLVIDGVVFTGSLSDLSQDQIKSIEVLKGTEATAIYGARAADGVLLISTKDGKYRPKVLGEKAVLDAYLENSIPGNALRSNFKDDAFWQPTLRTDALGKAQFKATFPDDITNWRVIILAMNERKQHQQYETSVKAYKTLLAQLSVPRFLVVGDTSQVIGKTLNYGQDTLQVKNQFLLNELTQNSQERSLVNALIDTLQIITPAIDTLDATYLVERSDGYLDGEKRQIPIIKKGLTAPKGNFLKIKSDTTIFLRDFQAGTPVLMRVDVGRQNALQTNIDYLKNYTYECNEQMASKLIAYLIDRQLKISYEQSLKNDRAIRRLTNRLVKNQNADGGWGWWNRSTSISWISKHVREALKMAQQANFSVDADLNRKQTIDLRIFDLETDTIPAYLLSHLENLHSIGEKIDYKRYLEVIKNTNRLSFTQQLQWWRLSQALDLEIDLSRLEDYLQKDAFGNTFFASKASNYNRWLPDQNVLQNTVDVIDLLHRDSSRSDWVSSSIDYLLKQRFYWNTYDRARFLQVVGPIIAQEASALEAPEVLINGLEAKDYPFQEGLDQQDSLRIEKRGPVPVYLSLTQDYYEVDPEARTDLFTVSTYFKDSVASLAAGTPTELLVNLEVHAAADYVWVKVPIPAACSYNEKPRARYPANHVEYYKDHAIFYFNRLKIGSYKMRIPLQPRYAGNYQLNPAQAALMYFPVLSGNNVGKRVVVD